MNNRNIKIGDRVRIKIKSNGEEKLGTVSNVMGDNFDIQLQNGIIETFNVKYLIPDRNDCCIKEYKRSVQMLAKIFIEEYFIDEGNYTEEELKKGYHLPEYYWAADCVGGVLCVDDYFFNMEDIILSLENNISSALLFGYYDFRLSEGMDFSDLKNQEKEKTIMNFKTYIDINGNTNYFKEKRKEYLELKIQELKEELKNEFNKEDF